MRAGATGGCLRSAPSHDNKLPESAAVMLFTIEHYCGSLFLECGEASPRSKVMLDFVKPHALTLVTLLTRIKSRL